MSLPTSTAPTDRPNRPPTNDDDRSDWRRRHRGDATSIVARLFAIRRYADRLHADSAADHSHRPPPRQQEPSVDRTPAGLDDAVDDDPATIAVDGGEPRFAVRETDHGLLVVADLNGVVRNDYETEIDLQGDALVLTVDNRFAWRVPVDDDGHSSIRDVSLNNDVLEARVHVE